MTGLIYRNLLLSHLNDADRHLLEPLEPVDLETRDSLEQAGVPITHVYFPETAVASVVMQSDQEIEIELGVTGLEGMTGLPLLYGDNRSMINTFIQIPGRALRLPARQLRSALDASATLRTYLMRYARTVHDQVAATATTNAAGTIEQRLARWLLMCQDRVGHDHIRLSHDFLSIMLGTRRASVTDAIHKLEGYGHIRSLRMDLEILDPPALEEICKAFYGPAEAEYRRIMGFGIEAGLTSAA